MNNNFVAMATAQCPVCLEVHSYNTAILISKKLKPIKKGNKVTGEADETFTGYGLCENHQNLFDDGYIALVAIEDNNNSDHVKQEAAVRTGDIIHLRRSVFNDMFNADLPEEQEMVFIDSEVVNTIKDIQANSKEEE